MTGFRSAGVSGAASSVGAGIILPWWLVVLLSVHTAARLADKMLQLAEH